MCPLASVSKKEERTNERTKLINSHKTLIRLNGLLESKRERVGERTWVSETFCLIFITFDDCNEMNGCEKRSLQELYSKCQKLNEVNALIKIRWKVWDIFLFLLNFAPDKKKSVFFTHIQIRKYFVEFLLLLLFIWSLDFSEFSTGENWTLKSLD